MMSWEFFLSRSKIRKKFIRYLKPIAFLLAALYCLITPAQMTSNGEYSFVMSVILTILVQLPLCALILYLILKIVVYTPQRTLNKEIEKMPDAHWGTRTFIIAPDGAKLIAPQSELKVSLERITSVEESRHAIALCDGKTPIFLLPKSDFSLSEVTEALNQEKTGMMK